ncbi:hypothetical protein [Nostoc sp. FACHB-892]|uniref:hypothetical protein n=1 Tax=Nostoc sp. FACHB-892 TaxID=2692843 RepID=UPI001686CB57|nr:hypothetical protein [Nostoc sp. FACHB-892]
MKNHTGILIVLDQGSVFTFVYWSKTIAKSPFEQTPSLPGVTQTRRGMELQVRV